MCKSDFFGKTIKSIITTDEYAQVISAQLDPRIDSIALYNYVRTTCNQQKQLHTKTLVCELRSEPEFTLGFAIVLHFSRKSTELRYLLVVGVCLHIKAQICTSFTVAKDVAVVVGVWGCLFTRQVAVPLDESHVKAVVRVRSPLRTGRVIVFRFLTSFIEVEGAFPPYIVPRNLDYWLCRVWACEVCREVWCKKIWSRWTSRTWTA